jgi:hypothetical protein
MLVRYVYCSALASRYANRGHIIELPWLIHPATNPSHYIFIHRTIALVAVSYTCLGCGVAACTRYNDLDPHRECYRAAIEHT